MELVDTLFQIENLFWLLVVIAAYLKGALSGMKTGEKIQHKKSVMIANIQGAIVITRERYTTSSCALDFEIDEEKLAELYDKYSVRRITGRTSGTKYEPERSD